MQAPPAGRSDRDNDAGGQRHGQPFLDAILRDAGMGAAGAPGHEARAPAGRCAAPITGCRWSSPSRPRASGAASCSTAGRWITRWSATACDSGSISARSRPSSSPMATGTMRAACRRRSRWCGPPMAGSRVPLHLHPGMFRERGSRQPDGGVLPMDRVPSPAEWEAMGAQPHVSREPAVVAGHVLVSGEIPRVTDYEIGLPGQVARAADDAPWQPDEWLSDERFIAVNLRGKGLVVFSACSHCGIVNVLHEARRLMPDLPLLAAMGGYHLSGTNERIIPQTVSDLGAFGHALDVPLPLHRLARAERAGTRPWRGGRGARRGRQDLRAGGVILLLQAAPLLLLLGLLVQRPGGAAGGGAGGAGNGAAGGLRVAAGRRRPRAVPGRGSGARRSSSRCSRSAWCWAGCCSMPPCRAAATRRRGRMRRRGPSSPRRC